MRPFKLFKHLVFILLIALAVFAYWFVPKYSFVKNNPGYCTHLTAQIYYCGIDANLESMFKTDK